MSETPCITECSGLSPELKASGSKLTKSIESMRKELADSQKQRDEAVKAIEIHRKDLEQLHSENAQLEQRAGDAEQKVALLLDQVEHSVDNYRRRSRTSDGLNVEHTNGAGLAGLKHARDASSENGSTYEGNDLDNRNSAALDNLANELETLRSHWRPPTRTTG